MWNNMIDVYMCIDILKTKNEIIYNLLLTAC